MPHKKEENGGKNSKNKMEKDKMEKENIKKKNIPQRPFSNEIIESIKTKNLKKKMNIASHIQKYDELILLLNTEIDRRSREREKGIKLLQTIRKKVNRMDSEFRRIEKVKRKQI